MSKLTKLKESVKTRLLNIQSLEGVAACSVGAVLVLFQALNITFVVACACIAYGIFKFWQK